MYLQFLRNPFENEYEKVVYEIWFKNPTYKIYHSRPPKYEILATPLHAHTKKEREYV